MLETLKFQVVRIFCYFLTPFILILLLVPIAFAGQGGPDAYGYTWKDSNEPGGPAYQWIDITTTGTQVTGLGDDNFAGPFGFIDGFQYFWYYPTQVWIGSNGYLSFSGNNFASPFPTIPNTASPHNFIAGMMSDLNFAGTGNPGTCYYRNTSDTIVISWINVPFWTIGSSFIGSNSFQIVLVRSDRSITFNYQSQLGMTQGDDITIGIENITGQLGLQHSKNIYPLGGYSVKFYYPTTTTYQAVDGGVHWNMEEGNGGVFVKRYSTVPVLTNVKNFGYQPLTNFSVSATISHPTALGMSGTGQIAGLSPRTDTSYTFNTPLIPTEPGIYNMVSQVGGIVGDLVATNNLLRTKIIAIDTSGTQIPMEYHDGIPAMGGISWNGGNGGIGYYMRPAFYPCQINGYRLMIASDPMANGCHLKIFDDDGPNGGPGTMLDSTYASPSSYVIGVNSLIPTVGNPINITRGGFYVLWLMPPGGSVALARDNTLPISNRSYEYVGGTWEPCRFRFTEDYFLGVTVNMGQSVTASTTLNACLGDTAEVTISHPTLTGVANAWLRMTYNPDSLTYVGFNSLNPAFSGMMLSGGNGVLTMTWFSSSNQTIAAGNLVNLRFKVNGNSNLIWDTLIVPSEFSDSSLNSVPQIFSNGSINHRTTRLVWNRNICQGQSFTLGNQSYTASGTYQGRRFGTGGACDTLIILNLNVLPRQTNPLVNICSNQMFSFNGLQLSSSGVYLDTLVNFLGCDSIVQLNLTVNPAYNQNLTMTICAGGSLQFGTQYLTMAGNYSHFFISSMGCDSLVTLKLIVSTPVTLVSYHQQNGFCPNDSVRIGLASPIPNAIYSWRKDGAIIPNATSDTLSVNQAGNYQLAVQVSPTCVIQSNTLTIGVLNCNRITGDLRYDNASQTPLAGVPIHLKSLLGNIVASDTTDSSGHYDMAGYSNGNYLLDAAINYIWGGVNSTDALQVTRYFTSLVSLSPLRIKVGDVNGSGITNSGDALLINRRITGLITSFSVGNFVNNLPSVNALGNPLVANLRALSTGDVNGTYNPQPTAPTLVLDTVIGGLGSGTATVSFTSSGSGVFERGICWGALPNPTVLGNKLVVGSGGYGFTQVFSGSMVGNYLYYARAFARTSHGEFYSNNMSFSTLPGQSCNGVSTVTDIDGNFYQGIQIGTQCWLQSNLKVSKYQNGDIAQYSIYNTNIANDSLFGKLYNYNSVVDERGLCPTGWHVPTDAEWTTLENQLGGSNLAGRALKSTAMQPTPGGWNPPNMGATNSSFFTGLPGGWKGNVGYNYLGLAGAWWSTSFSTGNNAWMRFLHSDVVFFAKNYHPFTDEFSVRCLKNSYPQINTLAITSLTHQEALVTGEVIIIGDRSATRGFCYSTTSNPTILNDTTMDGTGLGVYTGSIRNLIPLTTYYVRAYATNSMGTAYGNEVVFTTDTTPGIPCPFTPTVTDVDGNIYKTVQIGNQCWTQRNLRTGRYRNGDTISTGAYTIYINDPVNDGLFGKLYNHYAVTDSRGLCPTGWHVPSDSDWTNLTNNLGGYSAGGALKGKETQPAPGGWNPPNTGATNSSGFTALPGGWHNGSFQLLKSSGKWWSSTVSSGSNAWSLSLMSGSNIITPFNRPRTFALSVRCLQD